MDMMIEIATTIVAQMQKPTLAFLIGGMMLAALGSKLDVPEPVYKFVVMLLLLKVGLGAGISIREADLIALAVPAGLAAAVGIGIVLIGSGTLARWRGVSQMDGMATAGVFGAVSASTLAAGMAMLDAEQIFYEGFIGALYPFMDIAALVTAIVLARMAAARKTAGGQASGGTLTLSSVGGGTGTGWDASIVKGIVRDTFQSAAISALILGIAIGTGARPASRRSCAMPRPRCQHRLAASNPARPYCWWKKRLRAQ